MDRLGCGDVVVAHDGSIDAGMLICVPRGSVVQSMGRRRLGRRGFVLCAARPVCHNKGSRTVAAVRLPGFRV